MGDTTETRWFKIIAFIALGFFAGLFLANIIYYNRLRTGGVVTSGEATSMLVINAILFVIALLLFIWCLFRILATDDVQTVAKDKVVNYFTSTEPFIRSSAPTTVITPSALPITQVTPTVTTPIPAVTQVTPTTQFTTAPAVIQTTQFVRPNVTQAVPTQQVTPITFTSTPIAQAVPSTSIVNQPVTTTIQPGTSIINGIPSF